MRRRRASIVAPPLGVFRGQEPLPQALSEVTHHNLVLGMADDPGLRLAGIGRRRYLGGMLTVQDFATTIGGPNSRETLETVATTRNSRRSAISRGRPDTPAF